MKYISLIVVFLSSLSLFSQETIVEDASNPEAEFHVAINPLDSNNIVLATQHDFGGVRNITIYYTNDFGTTWNTSNYHGFSAGYIAGGDAVLSFDAAGNVLLVNLAATSTDLSTLLSKSTDGGATWSLVSTIVTGFPDKPWLAIDRYSTSPYLDNIYIPLVENNLNFYTLDGTYQTTNSLVIPDGDHLPSVVVKKDGTVFTSSVGLNSSNIIYVQQYSNGGSNLVHSTQVVTFPDYTFNAPDISLRFQPTAYLAIDNSGGSYDGRLYLSYTASESNNPDYFNVFLTFSDDNGLNWSPPSIVHSNQQDQVQQFYSSMYVNDIGILVLDWYDRKNYTNTNKLTDFFLGVSYDGGTSFTEIQLNTTPSDFDFVIPSSGDFGIGEYHQLVATNSTAVAFWSDGRTNDGDLNIYMAKVNLASAVNVEELSLISNKITISPLYPQPVVNNVYSDIEIKETTNIKYQVLNNSGQVLKSTDWVEYQTGKHKLEFNFDLSAGVYFVTVATDYGYFKTMKFVKH